MPTIWEQTYLIIPQTHLEIGGWRGTVNNREEGNENHKNMWRESVQISLLTSGFGA